MRLNAADVRTRTVLCGSVGFKECETHAQFVGPLETQPVILCSAAEGICLILPVTDWTSE